MKRLGGALLVSMVVLALFVLLTHCQVAAIPDSLPAGLTTVALATGLGTIPLWRRATSPGWSRRATLLYIVLAPAALFPALVVGSFITQCGSLPW